MSQPIHAKEAAFEINGQRVPATQFYAVACDPRRSVAVEACAGAGKTWMLVSRILRALLDGAQPHNILAITFTKKAAGEMRERLMHWLSDFAKASSAQRCQELVMRGLSDSEAQALQEPLGQLYRQLLQSGRPVQIRTFHSWFAALLRSSPMQTLQEMGLPWPYELLEDDTPAVALVWPRFYKQLEKDNAAHQDFVQLVMQHGRSNVQKALEGALSKRIEFTLAEREGAGVLERSVPDAASWMRSRGHLAFAELSQPLQRLLDPSVKAQWLSWAKSLGQEKNKTPQSAARAVIDAYGLLDRDPTSLSEALAILRKAFFVMSEDRLNNNLNKFPAALEAEPLLQALCEAQAQHEAWLYQQAMTRLTRVLMACFSDLKRERAWVDMNDIELAALHLLSDTEVGAWVQERLDASISHLLIDEFQDTNPLQWHALSAWLASYVGAAQRPSVFIVGDPKQSIYRFRRAEPQVFKDAQKVIQELGGDLLSCDHTRRNAQAVIEVLNQTFEQAQENQEFEGFRAHTTDAQQRGEVGRLPAVPRPQRHNEVAWHWRDSLSTPRVLAEETLRSLECQQAAHFVAQQLACGLKPQDIMVLARKRDRLSAMHLALRALGIPANLAEKKDLAQAPEVQDLVALLDVLVSTPHNLSLARALKSPLFGLTDEALMLLAACSQGKNWWSVLSNLEQEIQSLRDSQADLINDELIKKLRQAFEQLQRWQSHVQTLPPHDALSCIYQEGDVIARFVAAAPPTLRDAVQANLQALLSASLQVDGARFLTPYAFVRALKAGGIQAPQRQSQDAVQLLTVHGAKGLEAPCVLLLDTDAQPAKSPTMGVLIDWPGAQPAPQSWVYVLSEKNACPSAKALVAREQAARAREELNSLYVAMTRAKSCLVLSCVVPHNASVGTWWQRLAVPDMPAPPEVTMAKQSAAAPQVPTLPVLTRLPETGPAQLALDDEAAVSSRMGQAMHRLLEWAPLGALEVTAAQSQQAAREFSLTNQHMQEVNARAQAILNGQGAWAWDAQQVVWHANEVPVVMEGQMHRIDRLVRMKNEVWWVIDYKSASDPQSHQDLQRQLRRYRDAVAQLHPGQDVRAAFFNALGQVQELAEVDP
jgi:ATP-dependent helicase/nuclease subunit A